MSQGVIRREDLADVPSHRVPGRSAEKHLDGPIGEQDESIGRREEDAVLEMIHGSMHGIDLASLRQDLGAIRLHLLAEQLELIRQFPELVLRTSTASHVELAAAQPLHVLGELTDGFQRKAGQRDGHHERRPERQGAEGDRVPEGIIQATPDQGRGDTEPDRGDRIACSQ